MRTVIRGGWVIGYADGDHRLFRDGAVVAEGDRILFVGHGYDGEADRVIDARGKIVAPGLIDAHVHTGVQAAQRIIQDSGRQDFFGQPKSHFVVPREGTTVPYGSGRLAARFTVAELLRHGTTTFMEIGCYQGGIDDLVEETGRLGIRGYIGPAIQSAQLVGDEEGRIKAISDEGAGQKKLAAAREFIQRIDGCYEGRVRGLLVPRGADVCSLELYRATREIANELGVPIQTHAAFNIVEFFEIVLKYRMTPIEMLGKAGMLGPDLSVGHGNFIAESRFTNYAGGRDLELLAESGTTVAHCPINLARRGRFLDTWDRYRRAGVNLALGSDTFPRDIFLQMRAASYLGKVLTGSFLGAPAADVFRAATLGGARALQRPDLGRLAPGAKADVIVIDTSGFRWGVVRDPVKSLVDGAIGEDVELVMVDGIVRMENRTIPGVDLRALQEGAQVEAEEYWARVPEWDPLGRRAEQACPWSFSVIEPKH